MISGRTIHSKIKAKIAEWGRKQEALSSQLYEAESSIEGKTREREAAFVQLAQVYLPELTAKAIVETLPHLRTAAQEIFQLRQQERRSLEDRMSVIQRRRQTLEGQLNAVTEDLEQRVKAREGLEAEVAEVLEGNSTYTVLRQQALEARHRLEIAEARHEDAAREKKEKAPEYERNTLFAYLQRRKFETPQYHGIFLAQQLDKWVARLIGYDAQKRNYDELVQRPAEVQKLIASYKTELEGLVKQAQAIEKESADKHGLTSAVGRCEALIQQRKAVMAGIATTDSDYQRTSQERNALDNAKGTHYEQVIGSFKKYLKGQSIAQLHELARSTTTAADDRLVATMETVEGEINGQRKRAKGLKTEQAEVVEQLERLRSVEREFRTHDYEASRSRFESDLNMDTLLLYLILGQYTVRDVTRHMERNHSWEPEPVRYSSSSSWSSGSSHGGGGFSSGGGFGGGGFSSGGGFGR